MVNTYWFIAVLFGVSVTLFLLGGQTVFGSYMDRYSDINPATGLLGAITTWLLNWQNAIIFGGTLLALGVVASGNLYVIIPFAVLSLLMNIMIFPTDLGVLPYPFGTILTLFFNLSIFVISTAFVSGRG